MAGHYAAQAFHRGWAIATEEFRLLPGGVENPVSADPITKPLDDAFGLIRREYEERHFLGKIHALPSRVSLNNPALNNLSFTFRSSENQEGFLGQMEKGPAFWPGMMGTGDGEALALP